MDETKLCFKNLIEKKWDTVNDDEDEIQSYLKKSDDNLIIKIDETLFCKSRKKLIEEELKEQQISGGVYYLYEDTKNKKKSLINKKSRNEKIGDKSYSIYDIEYSGIDIKGLPLYEVTSYTVEQYEEIEQNEYDEPEQEF
jgi:hypothetical protein